jgi:hypothetical protein
MSAPRLRPLHIGVLSATQHWPVLLISYTTNLMLGMAITILPGISALLNVGHLTALRQAADGLDAWQGIDIVMSPLTDMTLGSIAGPTSMTSYLQQTTIIGVLTILAAPIIAWITRAFLYGGVLTTFEAPHRRFRMRHFIRSCWRWFGTFLVWGLAQAAVALVSVAIAAGLGAGLIALAGWWPIWLVVPAQAVIGLTLAAAFELARAAAVTADTRKIGPAFSTAIRFILNRPLVVARIYGLTSIFLLVAHLVYAQLKPHLPLVWWPLVLVFQQAFIVFRLWIRLSRTGGAVAVARGHEAPLDPRTV